MSLKEALFISKKLKLGRSVKFVTLAFKALATIEAWPGSPIKKVGDLNIEGFEALLMELGGDHDEASLWASLVSNAFGNVSFFLILSNLFTILALHIIFFSFHFSPFL